MVGASRKPEVLPLMQARTSATDPIQCSGRETERFGRLPLVVCQNPSCMAVNRVAYGKTHHQKKKGMPCFVVNTKLGMSEYLFYLSEIDKSNITPLKLLAE